MVARYSPISCKSFSLGSQGIMRYVLLCSNVYGIIADIPCSIVHLKAHSTDLGVQMHKTRMHAHTSTRNMTNTS